MQAYKPVAKSYAHSFHHTRFSGPYTFLTARISLDLKNHINLFLSWQNYQIRVQKLPSYFARF